MENDKNTLFDSSLVIHISGAWRNGSRMGLIKVGNATKFEHIYRKLLCECCQIR